MNIHCQQALLTYVDVRQIAAETGPVLFLRQPPYVDVRCVNATLGYCNRRIRESPIPPGVYVQD